MSRDRPIKSVRLQRGDAVEMTYDEIGHVMGISHARVQQIEAVALAKVATALGIAAKDVRRAVRAVMERGMRTQTSKCSFCGETTHNRATCPRRTDAQSQHKP